MRRGFTLLELLIVLVIVAMVTAIVAVRLRAPYQSARLEDALRRIEFIDCQTRTHARAFATSCQIMFQMDQGLLHSRQKGGDNIRHFEFSLPGVLSIERIMTPHIDVNSGTASIDMSSRGAAPTYAVCIATSTSQNTRKWLLFSGLTGRVAYPKDEIHVQQIFELLQTSGTDAH